jgi:hypothetical protein
MNPSIPAKAEVMEKTSMTVPSHTQKLLKMNFRISSTFTPYRTRFQVCRNPSVRV